MAMGFEPLGDSMGDDDASPIATINTTPLVDVMLVLLIIFLITIPVALQTVPVKLPVQASQPNQTLPGTITVAVDRDGRLFWNDAEINPTDLDARMRAIANQSPQPMVQVRGDRAGRFGPVGLVVKTARSAGLTKLSFVTQPRDGD